MWQCGNVGMRQCGNAVMCQCGLLKQVISHITVHL